MSNQEMSIEEAEGVVEQLQQAHRFAVGFYRRILPTLDMVANQLNFTFWNWGTLHTARPAGSGSQPSCRWAWDYVPLYASFHLYKKTSDVKQTDPEDYGIRFHLYIEDSFAPDNRTVKGQPDPIIMPKGKATLRVELYRPKFAVKESFEMLWDEKQEEDAVVGEWKTVSKSWDGIAFEWPLAEVIRDVQPIIADLKKHTGDG